LVALPNHKDSGFRWWRPDWGLHAREEQLPNYSLEQYSLGGSNRNLDTFNSAVRDRLALRPETPEEAETALADDICRMSRARIEQVLDAYHLRTRVNRCLNREEFDEPSTPGRDRRIRRTLEQLISVRIHRPRLVPEDIESISSLITERCPTLGIFPGVELKTVDFLYRLARNQVSWNPNDTVGERWGHTLPKPKSCPIY
ncbi:MAG: hypothetical protein N2578_06565, partial [Bdellovibrionaceae bacterium]|nr:hypothetical protein [Pseudobdellovibrionaceae bacterium]